MKCQSTTHSSVLSALCSALYTQRVPVTQSRQRQFRLAAVASAASCVLTVPMDTVKTRLITQKSVQPGGRPVYIGVRDCFRQVRRLLSALSLPLPLPAVCTTVNSAHCSHFVRPARGAPPLLGDCSARSREQGLRAQGQSARRFVLLHSRCISAPTCTH